MAYDAELAERIRGVLTDVPGVTDRHMFGGLAFLVNGHMIVAANRSGHLMVRTDPDRGDELLGGDVTLVVMRGRPMRGWLDVAPAALTTDEQLRGWVGEALEHVRTLPPK